VSRLRRRQESFNGALTPSPPPSKLLSLFKPASKKTTRCDRGTRQWQASSSLLFCEMANVCAVNTQRNNLIHLLNCFVHTLSPPRRTPCSGNKVSPFSSDKSCCFLVVHSLVRIYALQPVWESLLQFSSFRPAHTHASSNLGEHDKLLGIYEYSCAYVSCKWQWELSAFAPLECTSLKGKRKWALIKITVRWLFEDRKFL
jgi:hypothetical protein